MKIRLSEPGDAELVFDLINDPALLLEESPLNLETFGRLYVWLFHENPLKMSCQLLAFDEKGLIAHYGVVPLLFQLGANAHSPVKAGMVSNVIVHQRARVGSVFLKIQNNFFSEYPKAGLHFAYCTATRPHIIELYSKTGYQVAGKLPVYIRPLNPAAFFNYYVKNPLLRKCFSPLLRLSKKILLMRWGKKSTHLMIIKISMFGPELDAVVAAALSRYDFYAFRSHQTLNWRFATNQDRDYQIFIAYEGTQPLGYVVSRKMTMRGFSTLSVVDIVYAPDREDVGESLLSHVCELAKSENVDLLSTVFNPATHLTALFVRFGFLKTRESFTLLTHEPVGRVKILGPTAYKQWYITWFDHDYV